MNPREARKLLGPAKLEMTARDAAVGLAEPRGVVERGHPRRRMGPPAGEARGG